MPLYKRVDNNKFVKGKDVPKLLKQGVELVQVVKAPAPARAPAKTPAPIPQGRRIVAAGRTTRKAATSVPAAGARVASVARPQEPLPPSLRARSTSTAPVESTGTKQTPPILSLHRVSGGVYLLRLYDAAFTECGIAAMQKLKDATSIIIVTPTDTKTFNIGRTQAPLPAPVTMPEEDDGVPVEIDEEGGIHEAGEAEEDVDPMEAAMALAETEEHEHDQSPGVRRRARSSPQPGNSPCGRCNGQGLIKTPLEGGGWVDGTCPVCRGQGTIQRYGATPPRRR